MKKNICEALCLFLMAFLNSDNSAFRLQKVKKIMTIVRKEQQLPVATQCQAWWVFPPDCSWISLIYSKVVIISWETCLWLKRKSARTMMQYTMVRLWPCASYSDMFLLTTWHSTDGEEAKAICHCAAVTTHLTLRATKQHNRLQLRHTTCLVFWCSGAVRSRSRLHKDRHWLWVFDPTTSDLR